MLTSPLPRKPVGGVAGGRRGGYNQPAMVGATRQPVMRMTDLADEAATIALARRIAGAARPGDVIALSGDLGTGKTRFARAFVDAAVGNGEEVPSPTFTLVQTYDSPAGPIWHFDLYRLTRADEAYELGIEEALTDGIALIEWPDRLANLLPAERLDVDLAYGARPTARRACLTGHGSWAPRLADLLPDG
jgi:tRNA threonylcarbamoyladenosine biosynthesis protein TsaE